MCGIVTEAQFKDKKLMSTLALFKFKEVTKDEINHPPQESTSLLDTSSALFLPSKKSMKKIE